MDTISFIVVCLFFNLYFYIFLYAAVLCEANFIFIDHLFSAIGLQPLTRAIDRTTQYTDIMRYTGWPKKVSHHQIIKNCVKLY